MWQHAAITAIYETTRHTLGYFTNQYGDACLLLNIAEITAPAQAVLEYKLAQLGKLQCFDIDKSFGDIVNRLT